MLEPADLLLVIGVITGGGLLLVRAPKLAALLFFGAIILRAETAWKGLAFLVALAAVSFVQLLYLLVVVLAGAFLLGVVAKLVLWLIPEGDPRHTDGENRHLI